MKVVESVIERHVRVVQVVDLSGPAVDRDVDLADDRTGEAESDALPVGHAHLLADDVADRALHLGQRDLGRRCQCRRSLGRAGW